MSKPIGYAFWPYDLFPYLIGAKFTQLKGDKALVPSFGANAWVKPLFVLGLKEGEKMHHDLDGLRSLKTEAQGRINAKFQAELEAIVRTAGGRLKE